MPHEKIDLSQTTLSDALRSGVDIKDIRVPESEIKVDFVCSSGAGGQNVNKRKTKAQITWSISDSKAFSDDMKKILLESPVLKPYRLDDGRIRIEDQQQRTQERNEESAIDRLNEHVQKALTPKKKRKPSKPSKASRERRKQREINDRRKKKDRRQRFD